MVKIVFWRIIYFTQSQSWRESERWRERFPIYWFIPQMAVVAKANPVWSQQPVASTGLPCGWRGPRPRAILCCFPRSSAGSWSREKHLGLEQVFILDISAAGRGLMCHSCDDPLVEIFWFQGNFLIFLVVKKSNMN